MFGFIVHTPDVNPRLRLTTLMAKVPPYTNNGLFPKSHFIIDVEARTVTCLARSPRPTPGQPQGPPGPLLRLCRRDLRRLRPQDLLFDERQGRSVVSVHEVIETQNRRDDREHSSARELRTVRMGSEVGVCILGPGY
jgi:hypothetical protein